MGNTAIQCAFNLNQIRIPHLEETEMMLCAQGTLEELCLDFSTELNNSALSDKPLRIVGFTGPPGAGKSLAVSLITATLKNAKIGANPLLAGIIPMDGFHKSNAVLQLEGLSSAKGTPDSFDVVSYLMTLDRAHDASTVVYTPGYNRELGEPIAAQHRVERSGIVLTEGNYLASQDGAWSMVREAIDLLIYLDVPEKITHQRLLARHQAGGKSEEAAESWIRNVDDPDRLISEGSRHRADRVWVINE